MKAQEKSGHVSPARFGSLFPMLLAHAYGKFLKRQRLAGERTQCGTEAGCDNGGSKTFASHVGHHHQVRPIWKKQCVNVISSHFVTSGGASRDEKTCDFRHAFGQERSLDGAGGFQILLHASPFDVSLVQRRVLQRHRGP